MADSITLRLTHTGTIASELLLSDIEDGTDEVRSAQPKAGPFDISNYYEGDLVLLRLEMDDGGVPFTDLALMGMGIRGVQWALGGHI